jgi:hypothetical protein
MDILNNIKYFYSKNKTVVFNKAITSLRQEIASNPHNINATQLLADMLLEQGEAAEARDILEKLYQFQPQAAQSHLIKTLLILAKQADNENEQITLYQQIFKLDTKQQEAINAWQNIWQRRGDDARKAGDLETALAHYRTAHFEESVKKVVKKPVRRNPKAVKAPVSVDLKKVVEKKEQLLQERDQEIETLQQQLTAKIKQEEILNKRLENEKNALVNIESLTKDQEKRVDKYQQEVSGLKHELIIKEQTVMNLRETLKNYGKREKELTKFINDKQNETIAAKNESQNNNVLIILGTIIITIIIIFMGIISWQFSINNHNIPTPVVVPEPVKIPTIIPPPPKEPVKITVVKPPIVSQTLCVHFKKRSWIRIRDDNNKKLYEGIRKPGEILTLEGKPPFNMNVGNVNGVYVEYDCDINKVSAFPTREGEKNMFIIGDE